jgi:hypothetical protein
MPQIAINGPGGTPVRCWIEANKAACDCFSERPLATMVEAPRLARNSSSESLKLRWLRSALMVAWRSSLHQRRLRRADARQPRELALPGLESAGAVAAPRSFRTAAVKRQHRRSDAEIVASLARMSMSDSLTGGIRLKSARINL